jgi:uncharacterized membrane protein
VPLHPALVHFPLRFWVLVPLLDAWACRHVAAAQDTLWRQSGLMLLAWTLSVLACLFCSPDDPHQAQFAGSALHGIGAVVLVIGAHAGGRLAHVYHWPAACDALGIPRHSS